MVFRKRKERTDRLLNELHLGEFWLMPGAFRAEEATAGMMGSYGLPGGYGALAASAEQEEALRPFHTIVQPLWKRSVPGLSLIHISEPTRQAEISYAVFCLKKKKSKTNNAK